MIHSSESQIKERFWFARIIFLFLIHFGESKWIDSVRALTETLDLKVILKIKTSKSNVPIWRLFHKTWENGRKSNFKNWWSTWVTQRNKSVKFSQNELFIQTMFYNHITRQTEPSIQELNKTVFFYLSLSTRSEETEISKKRLLCQI